MFLIKHLAKNGGQVTRTAGVQKASVLLPLSAISKRRELHAKIVKSDKKGKFATPFTCLKSPDSCFTVFVREKVFKRLRFTVDRLLGKREPSRFTVNPLPAELKTLRFTLNPFPAELKMTVS